MSTSVISRSMPVEDSIEVIITTLVLLTLMIWVLA